MSWRGRNQKQTQTLEIIVGGTRGAGGRESRRPAERAPPSLRGRQRRQVTAGRTFQVRAPHTQESATPSTPWGSRTFLSVGAAVLLKSSTNPAPARPPETQRGVRSPAAFPGQTAPVTPNLLPSLGQGQAVLSTRSTVSCRSSHKPVASLPHRLPQRAPTRIQLSLQGLSPRGGRTSSRTHVSTKPPTRPEPTPLGLTPCSLSHQSSS